MDNQSLPESFHRKITYAPAPARLVDLMQGCFKNQDMIDRWSDLGEAGNARSFAVFMSRLKKGNTYLEEGDRFRPLSSKRLHNFTDILVEDESLRNKCFDTVATKNKYEAKYGDPTSDMRLFMNLEQACARHVLEKK